MKKQIILSFAVSLLFSTVLAQTANVHSGKNGIWILCPIGFANSGYYSIQRKSNEDYKTISKLSAPQTKEEIQARMSDIIKWNIGYNQMLSDAELNFLWKECKANRTDSLMAYMQNYPVLYALGMAFFDQTAKAAVKYTYKVLRIDKSNNVLSESKEISTSYPGAKLQTTFEAISGQATGDAISIRYNILNQGILHHVLVYRSYYLRSGYELIDPSTIFFLEKGKLILSVLDKSATPKVPYSYIVVGCDAAGNCGDSSAPFTLFNVPENALPPSVDRINTYSVENEKAIRISWKLSNTRDVVSIDIFKSMIHDGRYFRIATAAPDDTAYLDYKVDPVKNYYYTIVLNGAFQKSPTSPRIAGMLKASEENLLPVNNFNLQQDKQVVRLRWNKSEQDTRAYYVYRAIGADGELRLIGKEIESDSENLEAVDTLPTTPDNQTYAYAIRDINTSYNIGPFSDRLLAYSQGTLSLPVLTNVVAVSESDNATRVIWAAADRLENSVNGYELQIRKQNIVTSKDVGTPKLIALSAETNQYLDSNLTPGFHYFYSVRCVSFTGEKGSPSIEVGRKITPVEVPSIADVRIFSGETKAELKWTNPLGIKLSAVRIERAEKGMTPEILVHLTKGETSYIDAKVIKGKEYYYYFYALDSKGNSSVPEGPIGVRIK